MNERIKVLKRQAEEYAAEYGTEHCVFGQELIDVLDAKFAELIVEECAAVAVLKSIEVSKKLTTVTRENYVEMMRLTGMVLAFQDSADMIKEHFGVK